MRHHSPLVPLHLTPRQQPRTSTTNRQPRPRSHSRHRRSVRLQPAILLPSPYSNSVGWKLVDFTLRTRFDLLKRWDKLEMEDEVILGVNK